MNACVVVARVPYSLYLNTADVQSLTQRLRPYIQAFTCEF